MRLLTGPVWQELHTRPKTTPRPMPAAASRTSDRRTHEAPARSSPVRPNRDGAFPPLRGTFWTLRSIAAPAGHRLAAGVAPRRGRGRRRRRRLAGSATAGRSGRRSGSSGRAGRACAPRGRIGPRGGGADRTRPSRRRGRTGPPRAARPPPSGRRFLAASDPAPRHGRRGAAPRATNSRGSSIEPQERTTVTLVPRPSATDAGPAPPIVRIDRRCEPC